jgi:hypothetical protein
VLDISSAIIARVESMPESMDYFYVGKFFNPLPYTAARETAELTRSVNTQPPARRSEPSMSLLLVLAFCQ